eukprot:CAMPEP_0198727610 /NCGR_PEP_ID=MMETSP1475-20131203/4536_1 /TAXON_ID= ORGANISM="Unidentified sp., Strain CCMP1999" /NCGR_SAMPLE_ID=MMETSP1475 /ASSEMBLY_ACC=CAM_ASM_001111 /LENGTH=708 /DNA_ID=CAMNT_0044489673 /DNA_START=93 /DNA_END=2216 /DNA_ORIENTATION=+
MRLLPQLVAALASVALVAAQDDGEPDISRECFQALRECENESRGRACVRDEGSFRTFNAKQSCCESEIPTYAACVNRFPDCFADERQPIADFLQTCDAMGFDFETDYDYSSGTVQCELVRDYCSENEATRDGFRCVFNEEFFNTNGKRESCCNEQIAPYTQCLQDRSDSCPIDGDVGSQLDVTLSTCDVIGLSVDTDYDYSSAEPNCDLVQSHCEGASQGYNCIVNREEVSAAAQMRTCCEEDVPEYAECVTSKQDACPLSDARTNEIAVFAATCDLMGIPFETSIEAGEPDCAYSKRFCDSDSRGFVCTNEAQAMDEASQRENCCRTQLPQYGDCLERFSERCAIPDEERTELANKMATCDVIGMSGSTDFDASGGEASCSIVKDFCGDSSQGRECVAIEGDFPEGNLSRICCTREIPIYRRCLEGKDPPCAVTEDEIGAIEDKQEFCSSLGLEPEPTPVPNDEPTIDTDGDGEPDAVGIDTDGDGQPDSVDTDGDGNGDAEAIDTDDDGVPDAIDTDNDGEPDVAETPAPEDDDPVCFPSLAKVELKDGSVKLMRDVRIGDHIRSSATEFSEVFAFSHKIEDIWSNFVRLETTDGHAIELSPGHFLHVNGNLVAASAARVGDKVQTISSSSASIASTSTVRRQGLYNPQTMSGTIMVNGVQASAYTRAVPVKIARALLLFPKMLYKLGVRDPLFSLLDGNAPRLVW